VNFTPKQPRSSSSSRRVTRRAPDPWHTPVVVLGQGRGAERVSRFVLFLVFLCVLCLHVCDTRPMYVFVSGRGLQVDHGL
jgi:hypothetical protein